MKIYVAAEYRNREIVRNIHKELRQLGHEITCDWTDSSPYEPISVRAQNDVKGVRDAELLIIFMPVPHDYTGTWVEMGIALGGDIPVYIIGRVSESFVFVNHPLVSSFENIQDCMKRLKNGIVRKEEA